ncbi:hypothetical protein KAJ27_25150 [bacterium]|nr:hypothetical protein [bacterium]
MDAIVKKIKNKKKGIISHAVNKMTFRLFLLNSDNFGFTFSRMSFSFVMNGTFDLIDKAQEIEKKITYLNEKIVIVEIQDENSIILKSDDPHKKNDEIIFYDLFLENSNNIVKLRFYRIKNNNFKNSLIPSMFSYDQFERLLSDLAQIFF